MLSVDGMSVLLRQVSLSPYATLLYRDVSLLRDVWSLDLGGGVILECVLT